MARDQAEIERAIREELPIIFGEAEAVDDGVYISKRNAATEYAMTVVAPF
jgi:hypothetical protein